MGIEPWTLYILVKLSTTELYSKSFFILNKVLVA